MTQPITDKQIEELERDMKSVRIESDVRNIVQSLIARIRADSVWISEIRELTFMPDGTRLLDAVKNVMDESAH